MGKKGKRDELTEKENVVIDAPDVVPMEAGALEVLRLKNSSMIVAIKLLKDEQLDGIISCGSTGGFLSASTIILKLIPGVKKSGIGGSFPFLYQR